MEEDPRSLDLAMNERGALRELIESRGWAVLMEIAHGQRAVKESQVLKRPCPADSIMEQEFTKGEAAGIQLFELMPHNAIEALGFEIEEFKAQLPVTDNDEEEDDNVYKAP